MKTELLSSNPESILKAAKLLSEGQIIALPTETVYGLAGNAFSEDSVEKIFIAKERPSFDPLIVHVSQRCLSAPLGVIESLVIENILSDEILSWPAKDKINSLLKKFWPGPLTVVLPKGSNIPLKVTSEQNTVGLRCPAHPVFQQVLNQVPFPLAAPSANRFGRISPTTAMHVYQELDQRIPAILDGGACSVGVESTIIQILNPLEVKILRPGQIGAEELNSFLGIKVGSHQTLGQKNQAQLAPGMLDQHYAPRKPLYLIPHSFQDEDLARESIQALKLQGKIAFLSMNPFPYALRKKFQGQVAVLSIDSDLTEMSQKLFATLRQLDQDSMVDVIVSDIPIASNEGLSSAITDRLNRASLNKPI